jgi:hypothetical protein
VLTDREPWTEDGEFGWWREAFWGTRERELLGNNRHGNLPDELFNRMMKLYPDNILGRGVPSNEHLDFPSAELAAAAVSDAAILWAKNEEPK